MEKRNRISTIEKIFIKTGEIIAVRRWDGDIQHELDIHLPNVNFEKWNEAQKIKCRTSSFHFTDYTPAMWNAADNICTLYIDTSHNGQGSQWAKEQRAGNSIHYMQIESAKHQPVTDKHLVFLGDQTGIGHFCALQQLASDSADISGFISLKSRGTALAFKENCPWLPLQVVVSDDDMYHQTEHWIQERPDKEQYVFYIVGNAHTVVRLRKILKQHGVNGSMIKSEGFWH